MAEFLDKLKVRIDKGISTVNTKSKEIIGRQKTRLHLSELHAERKLLLQELGKLTYACYEPPGRLRLGAGSAQEGSPGKGAPPGKWEEAVITVLKRISEGGLPDILLEDTARKFKVTAGALYDETGRLLPESEKKGRTIMRLGRAVGKLGGAVKKESRVIDGARVTVYVFDKRATAAALDKAPGGAPASASAIIARCKKIMELDSGIARLEGELEKAARGRR